MVGTKVFTVSTVTAPMYIIQLGLLVQNLLTMRYSDVLSKFKRILLYRRLVFGFTIGKCSFPSYFCVFCQVVRRVVAVFCPLSCNCGSRPCRNRAAPCRRDTLSSSAGLRCRRCNGWCRRATVSPCGCRCGRSCSAYQGYAHWGAGDAALGNGRL